MEISSGRSLKIVLLGYGRMGKEVEKAALDRGHTIICKVSDASDWAQCVDMLEKADVAIDFSVPDVAGEHIECCFDLDKPIIMGTTAWQKDEQRLRARCMQENRSIVAASNFSIGVNIYLELIKKTAQMLKTQVQYKGSIEEIHHIHKLDAPSGTAITMNKAYMSVAGDNEIPIKSVREGEVVGVHKMIFDSEQDVLSIVHQAKSRAGFAIGAVVAAEWLYGKKGWHTMSDVLGF